MGQLQFNLQPERRIFTVSDLTARIRDLLAKNFTDIIVQGEISNCRPAASGHIYFTLKDDRAQIRCVFFKQQQRGTKFRPEDGLKVSVRGSISVYEARGEYQVYVESLEPLGRGALQLAFEQLKKKLETEGLFDPAHKKPLPLLPSRIGLITSRTGAAVRDVVRILKRRFPNVHLTLYPVLVQGEGAASQIIEALEYFNRTHSADVILLVRGGGSIEDLWSFNEESVARAIAACAIPVISGVGHETDFTIADFAADVRASTPSAAAELVVQTRRELDKHVADLLNNLDSLIHYKLLVLLRRVHELIGRSGFRRPQDLLRQSRQRSDEMASRLALGLRSRVKESHKRLTNAQVRIARVDLRARVAAFRKRASELEARLGFDLRARLETSRRRYMVAHLRIASFDFRVKMAALRLRLEKLSHDLASCMERKIRLKREGWQRVALQLQERSPLQLLERGYAIATDSAGNILRDADQVSLGDQVRVQLRRGRLRTEVKDKSS
ncbi:MAG TPA: exodeoxyribonuclease VII large subunit [Verrucomicrobiae bacterium]|nr:exodeoxyribonuclease VII large subunit [Verrucomicrobiae bacterium]